MLQKYLPQHDSVPRSQGLIQLIECARDSLRRDRSLEHDPPLEHQWSSREDVPWVELTSLGPKKVSLGAVDSDNVVVIPALDQSGELVWQTQ